MKKNEAFTLIELSIVLIIIGLVIGGVIAAQSLIQSAASRGVIRESNEYINLIKIFREGYGFYPGDFPFATRTWGVGTNGNGNMLIEDEGVGESQQLWYHLKISNMLQGNYTGTNLAYSKVLSSKNASITVKPNGLYQVVDRNYLQYGTGYNELMTPIQAYDIDRKIDDGVPNRGIVRAFGYPDCAKESNNINPIGSNYTGNGIYNIAYNKSGCSQFLFYID